MYEILDHLTRDACVLDLGCRDGSFRHGAYPFQTVLVDLHPPPGAGSLSVQADAGRLPFRSRTFDAVVLNHCLEHIESLQPALREIGRVVKPDGAAFVSVPDARTFADRLYRAVARNAGGHVNLFDSQTELERTLVSYFGLPHVATRVLHTGLTFLNRKNVVGNPAIRSQMRFAGFPEPLLTSINAMLRKIDRRFRTRLSVYGWGMYFGRMGEPVDTRPMMNVCSRCGEGRLFEEVAKQYVCQCGARNIGVPD